MLTILACTVCFVAGFIVCAVLASDNAKKIQRFERLLEWMAWGDYPQPTLARFQLAARRVLQGRDP